MSKKIATKVGTMKKRIIIIAVIVACFVATIIYHLPVKVTKEMPMCSIDGELINAKLDLTWRKSFFNPKTLSGSVFIDGKEYRSVKLGNDEPSIRLKEKILGDEISPWFHQANKTGVAIHEDMFTIILYDENFDKFGFHLSNKEGETTFYGPAESKEEAIALSHSKIE